MINDLHLHRKPRSKDIREVKDEQVRSFVVTQLLYGKLVCVLVCLKWIKCVYARTRCDHLGADIVSKGFQENFFEYHATQ